MRPRTRRFLISSLVVLLITAGAAAYFSRYLPDRWNPWKPLRIDEAPNVEVHILPGVLHGFMMPWNAKAFDQRARDFTMGRALAILAGLRDPGAQEKLRQAS